MPAKMFDNATRAAKLLGLFPCLHGEDDVDGTRVGPAVVRRFVARPAAFDEFSKVVACLGVFRVLVNREPPGPGT